MVYRLSDSSFPNGFAKLSSMPRVIKQQLKATFFRYRKLQKSIQRHCFFL